MFGAALPDGAAGERLTGGVEVGDMGMKAIAVLVGGGTLLVGMRGDHGGVDVDHIRDWVGTGFPSCRSGSGSCARDGGERVLIDRLQAPPRGGVRRYLAERPRLVPLHRAVRDRLATTGNHDGQVNEHFPSIVLAAAPFRRSRPG